MGNSPLGTQLEAKGAFGCRSLAAECALRGYLCPGDGQSTVPPSPALGWVGELRQWVPWGFHLLFQSKLVKYFSRQLSCKKKVALQERNAKLEGFPQLLHWFRIVDIRKEVMEVRAGHPPHREGLQTSPVLFFPGDWGILEQNEARGCFFSGMETDLKPVWPWSGLEWDGTKEACGGQS